MMRREKYFNFLFDWTNAEKDNEFKAKTEEYLDFLINDYATINEFFNKQISKPPVDKSFYEYTTGMLSTLKYAIDDIKNTLDSERPQNNSDYLLCFLSLQEKYKTLQLLYKCLEATEYQRGQLRAASDIRKGLKYLTQSFFNYNVDHPDCLIA